MSTQRKSYPPEFKARIALEALKEQKTLNQLGSEYGVHPNQVSTWKKQLQSELPRVFSSAARGEVSRRQQDQRAEVTLKNRHTNPVPAAVWEAPAGYRRVGSDDINRKMEETFQNPMLQQAMRQTIIASANVVNAAASSEAGS